MVTGVIVISENRQVTLDPIKTSRSFVKDNDR